MPDIRPSIQSAADRMVRGTSAFSPRLRALGGASPVQAANDRLVRSTQEIPGCLRGSCGMGDLNSGAMLGFLGFMGALYLMTRK